MAGRTRGDREACTGEQAGHGDRGALQTQWGEMGEVKRQPGLMKPLVSEI